MPTDNTICKVCGGKGTVRKEVEDEGEITVLFAFCEACEGKGNILSDPDTFDIDSEDEDE